MLLGGEKKSLGIQKCNTCPNELKWSIMVSTKVWHDEEDTEDRAFQ